MTFYIIINNIFLSSDNIFEFGYIISD